MTDKKTAFHLVTPPDGLVEKPAYPPQRAEVDEKELLLELLAQQQRVAQAGLVTSALAHDFNNHLQVISGSTFLALESRDPGEWRSALEAVQAQCCAMTETTRAFLHFVRRRDRSEAGTFLLSRVVREAHRLTWSLAHGRRVALSYSVSADAEVRGDQRLAIQALVNLITNAIRASGSGGRVELFATCPEPDTCRLVVRDNGPGIPQEARKRLFRPFVTGRPQGTGLGLFIVRQTVRDLGGSIRVCSSTEGTIFQIDLPRWQA